MKPKCLCVVLLFMSVHVQAQERVYTFDNTLTNIPSNAFTNDQRKYPKESDFKVQAYASMSSADGERAALVTIKNTSSGNRFFESPHIMALFADGQRVAPKMSADKYTVGGHDTLTLTLEFGRYNYPIVNVYTSNN
ncbi:hypothetical protein PA25_36330 [Pseudoalteromonas sp. A25]|uniref:hypothetical protein n=1 Tax=Pseudoalteromonas sp. A25 TaxID=116092 RepID=UPI0012603F1B|nr:hypothetical protein [Pseudoalteromonas sp. A25]BBN83648.1 hypothetical protein PA25_36330 [Pseudoalteromonas sp. A25]